jgi:hypothetical protein
VPFVVNTSFAAFAPIAVNAPEKSVSLCHTRSARHPDGRQASERFHQLASRPEGPCVSFHIACGMNRTVAKGIAIPFAVLSPARLQRRGPQQAWCWLVGVERRQARQKTISPGRSRGRTTRAEGLALGKRSIRPTPHCRRRERSRSRAPDAPDFWRVGMVQAKRH